MSRDNKIRLVYGSIIAATFLSWIVFGRTSISQSWHMRLAQKHMLLLEQIAQTHPEFRDVRFLMSTGKDGCLVVSGTVESEKEMAELKNIIEGLKPREFVWYMVSYGQPETVK